MVKNISINTKKDIETIFKLENLKGKGFFSLISFHKICIFSERRQKEK